MHADRAWRAPVAWCCIARSAPCERPDLLRDVVEAGGLADRDRPAAGRAAPPCWRRSRPRGRGSSPPGDAERRRIERDLHDGAQQRLVSIGLALRHAQHELWPGVADVRGARVGRAVAEVAVAIGELRELPAGFHPPQLDAGLAPALRELAARRAAAGRGAGTSERFSAGVEAAAYFIACEGLTNAIKHAQASAVTVSAAAADGGSVVLIADDGVGGAAPIAGGSGLRGLADRVAAHGGTLRIDSPAGAAPRITAELPCAS